MIFAPWGAVTEREGHYAGAPGATEDTDYKRVEDHRHREPRRHARFLRPLSDRLCARVQVPREGHPCRASYGGEYLGRVGEDKCRPPAGPRVEIHRPSAPPHPRALRSTRRNCLRTEP